MDSFAPIPFLRNLRLMCLARSESRAPKWKFRVASDLVMQLQPKPSCLPGRVLESFEGVAVMVAAASATAEMLTTRPRRPVKAWWRRNFEIVSYAKNSKEWHLFIGQGMYTRNRADGDDVLIWRIRSAFTDGFFEAPPPDAFFANHCLICGRPLTDNASIARRIGPECESPRGSPDRDVLWTEDEEIALSCPVADCLADEADLSPRLARNELAGNHHFALAP
jgi:hypothetical protein